LLTRQSNRQLIYLTSKSSLTRSIQLVGYSSRQISLKTTSHGWLHDYGGTTIACFPSWESQPSTLSRVWGISMVSTLTKTTRTHWCATASQQRKVTFPHTASYFCCKRS